MGFGHRCENGLSLDPEHSGCILVGERGEALIAIGIPIGFRWRLRLAAGRELWLQRLQRLQRHAHHIQCRLQRRVAALCGEREAAIVAANQGGAERQTHIMERADGAEAALILRAGAIIIAVAARSWLALLIIIVVVVIVGGMLLIGFDFG